MNADAFVADDRVPHAKSPALAADDCVRRPATYGAMVCKHFSTGNGPPKQSVNPCVGIKADAGGGFNAA